MPHPQPPQPPLQIGCLIFPKIDQTDFTGPFEVLSRVSHSTFHVIGKAATPLRDAKGLILTPEKSIEDAPPLDILCIPGGPGAAAVMEDDELLAFIRSRAAAASYVFSICTGALILGAAGLLKGRRATTHWASFELLEPLGAIAVDERVVIDGNLISAAGVTAGIDGALRLAAMLRGDTAAQEIQLYMEYAPQPPFHAGRPQTAPSEVLANARMATAPLLAKRRAIVERIVASWR